MGAPSPAPAEKPLPPTPCLSGDPLPEEPPNGLPHQPEAPAKGGGQGPPSWARRGRQRPEFSAARPAGPHPCHAGRSGLHRPALTLHGSWPLGALPGHTQGGDVPLTSVR